MRLQKFLCICKRYLKQKHIDSPELSAEIIFAHVLGKSRLNIILEDDILSKNQIRNILKFVRRRGQGMPLAYLIGKKEFYGREFLVDENVLIPRPCTELIIDLCKKYISMSKNMYFADIGTGSGNIAITLALEFSNLKGIAIDISKKALDLAKKNAKRFNVENRLVFVKGDLLSGVKKNKLDLIVTNPPYLSPTLLKNAMKEVIMFEPFVALYGGGDDGLKIPKKIFDQAPIILKKGGIIMAELDTSQLQFVKTYLTNQRVWREIKIYKDLEQKDRVIFAKRI